MDIMTKIVLLASFAALSVARPARASDFFVVTDTFKSQQDAQTRAASVGGWVLDTDAYSGLGPGLFAVVRGPCSPRTVVLGRLVAAECQVAGQPVILTGVVQPSVKDRTDTTR
jgi:hypothetical protein